MTDCTVVIFHFESLAYLRAVVRLIKRYGDEKIIIAEQSRDLSVKETVYKEFGSDNKILIVEMPSWGSGYAVDHVMRNANINTEFLCTIDVDTLPIHKNWLSAPIKLIQQTDFKWVGVHAEIEDAYSYMGKFFCMCQHFRVGRTRDYHDLSINGGFTKNDHRKRISFVCNEWHGWSDDAVAAHWWEDKYRNNSKFTLAVTDYLGVAPKEGRYGRYTDDLVFHFAFSYNYKMVRDQKESLGDEFIEWMRRMNSEGLGDEMIAEILNKLRPLERQIPRLCWDGQSKASFVPNRELNDLFDRLKNEDIS